MAKKRMRKRVADKRRESATRRHNLMTNDYGESRGHKQND